MNGTTVLQERLGGVGSEPIGDEGAGSRRSASETSDAIRKLHAPLLLINAADTVRFHRRINELLANLLPNVRVAEIPGTHGASRTSEAEFLAGTRAFLADVN